MMTDTLLILIPLSKDDLNFPDTREGNASLRLSAWGTASAFLANRMENKAWYKSFHPAADVYGIPVRKPFGVILGREHPDEFCAFYQLGIQMRNRAASLVHERLTEKGELLDGSDAEREFLMIADPDQETIAALSWYTDASTGKLPPGCGLYHYGYDTVMVPQKVQKEILSSAARYALCIVNLHLQKG